MKKKITGGINVGTSSILVTFVLLCLVTFAALSYLSANSDYKLSQQTAQRATDFYKANEVAEIKYQDIDATLKGAAADEDELNRLLAGKDVTIDCSGDAPLISYDVTVSSSQKLHVQLCYAEGSNLVVTKWQTENADTWSDSEGVTLEDDGIGFMTFP